MGNEIKAHCKVSRKLHSKARQQYRTDRNSVKSDSRLCGRIISSHYSKRNLAVFLVNSPNFRTPEPEIVSGKQPDFSGSYRGEEGGPCPWPKASNPAFFIYQEGSCFALISIARKATEQNEENRASKA